MTGPLRERDDAHALLSAEIERARAGSGRLVLLRGASGTGRTAVLETAARHAEDRGLRVLRVRCSPEDTSVPFAMVLHLLGPVPEFTDTAPGGDDRGSAARLWRLLRSYAAEGPVLLAVDDVHLADDSSRRWLTEAARHVDRLPVLLVATERSQYDVDPRPAGLTQALSPSLVRTHTLAPLSDSAAAALVREAFPDASARWTEECVRAGAGSPLLLHALLDDLGGTPHPDGVPPVPDSCAALYPGSYPAAVSWWLNSAGPATADVARCLAALEQAWPTGPPDHRAALRHALPRQRAAAPGAAYRQAPPSDGAYGQTQLSAGGYGQAPPWHGADRQASLSDGADRQASPFGTADRQASAPDAAYGQAPSSDGVYGQAPLSDGVYGQAPSSDGAYGQAPLSDGVYGQAPLDGAYGQAPPSDAAYPQGSVVGAVRRHTHETPTARTRRPRDIAPGCRDVWSADPGGGADPRSPLPGGPGPGAELPEHGPYPHPDELAGPADGVPYPVHGPYDGPYDGRTESAPRAAYGRTGPPAHAPHRTTLWRTPSPPPAQGSAGDPVDVLAEAAGADPARIEGWLAAMTRLGLLRPDEGGRPRYAHPLLRDAVLTGWPQNAPRGRAPVGGGSDAAPRRPCRGGRPAPAAHPGRRALLGAARPARRRDRRRARRPARRRRRLSAPGAGRAGVRRSQAAAADRTGLPGVRVGRHPGRHRPARRGPAPAGRAAQPGAYGRRPRHRPGGARRDPDGDGGAAPHRGPAVRPPGPGPHRADRHRAAVRRGPGDPAGGVPVAVRDRPALPGAGRHRGAGPAGAVRGDGRADLRRRGDGPGAGPARPAHRPAGRTLSPRHGRRRRPVGRRTRRGRTAGGTRPGRTAPRPAAPDAARAAQHPRRHRCLPRRPRPAARPRRRPRARTRLRTHQPGRPRPDGPGAHRPHRRGPALRRPVRPARGAGELGAEPLPVRAGRAARRHRRPGGRPARLPGVRAPPGGPGGDQPGRHPVADRRRRMPAGAGRRPRGAGPGDGGTAAGPGVEHAAHRGPRPARAGHRHRRAPRPGTGRGGRTDPAGRARRHRHGADPRAARPGPPAPGRGRARTRPGPAARGGGTGRTQGRPALAHPGRAGPARGRRPRPGGVPHRRRRPDRQRAPDRRTGRRRPHQHRDRRPAAPRPAHRGDPPDQYLPQAADTAQDGAAGRPGARRAPGTGAAPRHPVL
ncbi:LOW QUALITY PROTEIN: transcriptional regulatory protein, partial [Streptomyces lividans TK24]